MTNYYHAVIVCVDGSSYIQPVRDVFELIDLLEVLGQDYYCFDFLD